MIWQLDVLLLVIVAVTAVIALRLADLLAAVAVLAAFSIFVALLFAGMGAVDVAFVEAVLGSAFVGVLFFATVLLTKRRDDQPDRRGARWLATGVIGAFLGLMVYASTDLPDRAEASAPAHLHVSPRYIEGSLPDANTPNVVTAVLADYRSHDTLGETLVIFTAGLAVVLILGRALGRPPAPPPDRRPARREQQP